MLKLFVVEALVVAVVRPDSIVVAELVTVVAADAAAKVVDVRISVVAAFAVVVRSKEPS